MNKPIQIKYNCPESLTDMPRSSCGYYCEMCQKEIFDFRGKTLGEIKDIQSRGNVQCGIFDREVAEEKLATKVQRIFRIAFAAVFILGFNTSMLFGQTKLIYPVAEDTTEQIDQEVLTVKGTVYNHRDKPIKATYTYYINGKNHEIETDEEGRFEVQLPTSIFDTYPSYYISFYAEGMESEHIILQFEDEIEYVKDVHMEKYKNRKPKQDEEYLLGFF